MLLPDILCPETMQAFLRGDKVSDKSIELPPIEFVAPRAIAQLNADTLERYVGSYDIEDSDDVRKVILAGDILFTRRAGGEPLPIRPTSETSFFYEGSLTYLEFDVDADGEVKGMRVFHEGVGSGEYAERD